MKVGGGSISSWSLQNGSVAWVEHTGEPEQTEKKPIKDQHLGTHNGSLARFRVLLFPSQCEMGREGEKEKRHTN